MWVAWVIESGIECLAYRCSDHKTKKKCALKMTRIKNKFHKDAHIEIEMHESIKPNDKLEKSN